MAERIGNDVTDADRFYRLGLIDSDIEAIMVTMHVCEGFVEWEFSGAIVSTQKKSFFRFFLATNIFWKIVGVKRVG